MEIKRFVIEKIEGLDVGGSQWTVWLHARTYEDEKITF
jgi:hypothetical protein